jgi:hypothetical protein
MKMPGNLAAREVVFPVPRSDAMQNIARLAVLSALAVTAMALSGCSGHYAINIEAGGAASAHMETSLDEGVIRGVMTRMAEYAGEEAPAAGEPFFDKKAISDSFAGRKDVNLKKVEILGPASMAVTVSVPDIAKVGSQNGGESPFFKLKKANGLNTLMFSLDRGNVARLPEIFPTMDSGLLELLSPPSLYGDDISAQEYRDSSLALFLGTKNLPSIDKSAAEIKITVPSKITASTGGKAEGATFTASLPLLTVLVLERPFEFSLSWKD